MTEDSYGDVDTEEDEEDEDIVICLGPLEHLMFSKQNGREGVWGIFLLQLSRQGHIVSSSNSKRIPVASHRGQLVDCPAATIFLLFAPRSSMQKALITVARVLEH